MFQKDFVGLKSSDIMKVLGNKDSFELFNIIVEKVNIDSRFLQSTSKLSKKRYYSGIQKLMACGLVRRKSKNFSLTSFGQIINDLKVKMDTTVNEYYRLMAFDLVINSKGMGRKERRELVEEFIKNIEIKTILIGKSNYSEVTAK